jgi:hypothetical protein
VKTATAGMAGGLVVAALLTAESNAPGSTAGGAHQLRTAIVPAAGEVLGAAGDAVLQVRAEANRQGLNPGAVFAPPDPSLTEPGPQVTAPPGSLGGG